MSDTDTIDTNASVDGSADTDLGSDIVSTDGYSSVEYENSESEKSDDYEDSGDDNDQVEADEEGSGSNSEHSDAEDYRTLKKKPKLQTNPVKARKSLGDALAHILANPNATATATIADPSSSTPVPILAKRKGIERKLEEAKLDAKAKAILRRERLANRDVGKIVTPDPTKFNYEKSLRKIATKGVVQLFNTIHQVQLAREKRIKDIEAKKGQATSNKPGITTTTTNPITTTVSANTSTSTSTQTSLQKQGKQLSKASFLDLLKSGVKKPLAKPIIETE